MADTLALSPPGTLAAAWLVARKDLAIEFRTRTAFLSAVVFALLGVTIFYFAWDSTAVSAPDLAPGVLWVIFTFAGLLGLQRSFGSELADRAMDGLLGAPISREAIYLGKALANLVFVSGILAVTIPAVVLFYNLPIGSGIVALAGIAGARGHRARRGGHAVQRDGREHAHGGAVAAHAQPPILRAHRHGRGAVVGAAHGGPSHRRGVAVAAHPPGVRHRVRHGVHPRVSVHTRRMTSSSIASPPVVRRTGFDALMAVAIVAIAAVYVRALFFTPVEAVQGPAQKILYIHATSAFIALYVAFVLMAISSALYLWLKDEKLDRVAESAAEVGLMFTTVVLVTGPLWGKTIWGAWWTWDARLTSTLFLWFIIVAYLLLRGAVEERGRRARYSAVLGMSAALLVPFIHLSVYLFRTLHPMPILLKPSAPSMPSEMQVTFFTAFFAFVLLFAALLRARYRVATLRDYVADLEQERA